MTEEDELDCLHHLDYLHQILVAHFDGDNQDWIVFTIWTTFTKSWLYHIID